MKIVLLVTAHMRTSAAEPESEPVHLPGAGAAEKFYSEPELEPEYFPGAGAGTEQKCRRSASLIIIKDDIFKSKL